MTPPPREYWRVWSDSAQDFLHEGYCYECGEDLERRYVDERNAQLDADSANRVARIERRPIADWRPVHCREVVIDG